ncbi:Spore germination protein XC [Trichinella pseudospiralis]
MKCCLYKVTCVYAFGSAMTSLGLAFECEKCNKLWVSTAYREKMSCFYFAPNAQLYLIGNHLMECSVIALSAIVVTESRIKNSNFILRRLRNVFISLFFIFSLTCWLVGLWFSTSMSGDQFVTSCYFVDVFSFPPGICKKEPSSAISVLLYVSDVKLQHTSGFLK